MSFEIQLLSGAHDREAFDCGEPALNEFLRRHARQNQERGVSRTFVAVPRGERAMVGFYSLTAGAVAFTAVPEELRRRLPRYPVPVAYLGRLATCRSVRGQGLGEALLFDATVRTLRVASEIGVVGIDVWAKTEHAREYYARYGFQSLSDDRCTCSFRSGRWRSCWAGDATRDASACSPLRSCSLRHVRMKRIHDLRGLRRLLGRRRAINTCPLGGGRAPVRMLGLDPRTRQLRTRLPIQLLRVPGHP